ncbi:small GTP-binding protein domain-containing protein [Desulfonispora thiosulfatigenes DSM 11270]|uniref:Small GTP-binding protein domain-containing protein n=1 Tax=Desulfonispora thiosulfatigenes DSM 11270 TaxID=656914 RepID=A0A1W1UIH3_DESTI|nr:dynamin family protein [Desulfonispora thiosulfatigenes]SMB80870.1 small GTP-binding protein domain-containing protein [Desulfonispora thiosulfatigenes DSM 11270]
MTQNINQQAKIKILKGKILAFYEYLLAQGDQDNAQKVKQLAGKLVKEEFAIAFCGHFSAGKSSMINRLVGENILPSSPIPTSANLVKVKEGDEYAKVFFKNEKPRLYRAPYDYKMVKNYCKDGDLIKEIEISYTDINLPSKTVIMDTPGIDSVDDAHRIATESALYLADLVFYVMDYNHVQSEVNFMFIKELTEAGKEVYLVINQVDKHSDKELSFTDFKISVAESFASWGVNPADIFYTSLKEEKHEHNQFQRLQDFLAERLEEKDTLLVKSIFHSLQKLLKDHFDLINKKNELMLKPFRDILNKLSSKEYEDLENSYNGLWQEKNDLIGAVEKAEQEFNSEVKRLLDSAYLMSFQTRELAQSYLESCQPGFKAGFLFRKQKTEEERQKRLDIFYQDTLIKTKSQVEWHLRNFLVNFLKDKRIENKELLAKIQDFHVNFSSQLLTSLVKGGAVLSNTTVMNYTTDVVSEIKSFAKNSLEELKDEILTSLQEKNEAVEARISEKLAGFKQYITAFEQVKKQESTEQAHRKKIEMLISNAEALEDERCHLFNIVEEEYEVVDGKTMIVQKILEKSNLPLKNSKNKELTSKVVSTPNKLALDESSDRMKQTSEKLNKTAQIIKDLPGFKKLASELEEKGNRLENKGFTVALFGAFSAGKSSFANALIGERVLPVSPNPMTAAINKIKPVNNKYQHGTVIIKVKEEVAMLEDINHALKLFEFHAESLNNALEIVENIDSKSGQQGASEKANFTFLQAFKRGFKTFKGQFGSVIETTMDEFGDYVAKEEKSCFVEWIDLYYDCSLTQRGITLVDTPGADSINARHTSVAFDYIKNSDAILFVTYYNHAFSKPDREFLIQLGRVKDSFQLDKMFFIINAIDLANNEEEKEEVIEYVHEHLIKYGVRKPNLYSLSSLHALKEKRKK